MHTNAAPALRRSRAAVRWLLALCAALLVGLSVPSLALSLTLEDVKAMASTGAIDENTMINIINNSGQRFEITDKVEADLKAAGVSERVIKALKATSGSGGTGTTGSDLGGPVPTPATAGNLGRVIAQGARTAKQQFEIESATAQRLADQQRMEAMKAELGIAFQGVASVVRDWESADKWAALATCHNFLAEFQPPANTDEAYTANWCKGAAFHDLGLHSLAAPILKDVALMGSERERFTTAVDMLIDSAEAASYFPPALADLDKLYVEDKARDFQDRFNYFVGRFYMDTLKDYERAITLLSRVAPESPLYPKAMYASAVMQASPELDQYKTAVQNFQNAIVSAEAMESPDRSLTDIVELSYMALARIAYEAANYDGALYYYNKVDTFSPRYPEVLFETAWTHFIKGDVRNALGTFHSVSSPYYDGYYFPDLWVLEATAYLNLCRYELAREALATFSELYLAKAPLLSRFIAQQTDPAQIFDNVVAAIDAGDSGPLPEIFGEAVLSNVRFYTIHKTIAQLDAELARLESTAAQLGPYGQELLGKLKAAAENKRFEAGIETQNILRGIEDELGEWDVTSTEVAIEIDIAEKELQEKCLTLTAQGKSCEFTTEEETVLFLVADDWQFWPFEGEYWVDEVGSYKSYLGDRCRQVEQLAEGETPAE